MGLAGGASAQAAQTITVQPDRIHWDEIPDRLPGTYRGLILVETTVSGGGCVCAPGTTTTVQLDITAEDPVTEAVVSPSSYAIDWWSEPHEMHEGHQKVVQVTLHMAQTSANLAKFSLETSAATDSPIHQTNALDSAYAIPLPQEAHDTATQEDTEEDDEANASGDREARTQSASEPGDLEQAAVPGVGAIAALIALAVVAWRRRGV